MMTDTQRADLEQATLTYESALHLAMPYLASRGISEHTAREFRLGVVTPENALPGDEDYVGRLTLPYITLGGVAQLRFRALQPDQSPKYLSRSGSKTLLFGVTALAKPYSYMVLTEGEIDAMTWTQINIPAVGVPGAQNWKAHWKNLLYSYDRLFVICDGDGPGRDFGRKVSSHLESATIIHLPDGMDSNDVYVQQGAQALLEKVGMQ